MPEDAQIVSESHPASGWLGSHAAPNAALAAVALAVRRFSGKRRMQVAPLGHDVSSHPASVQ